MPPRRHTALRALAPLGLLALALAAGCSDLDRRAAINDRAERLPGLYDAGRTQKGRVAVGNVLIDTGGEPFLGNRITFDPHGDALPPEVEQPNRVSINPTTAQPFSAYVEQISNAVRLPIRLPRRCDLPSATATPGTGAGDHPPIPDPPLLFSFRGQLSEALTQLGGLAGYTWQYSEAQRTIEFACLMVKRFRLAVQPELAQGGLNGNASAAQGGDQTKLLNEMRLSLGKLLAGEGVFELEPTSGDLVVKAPPAQMALVEEYVNDQNRRRSHVIGFEVTILSVDLDSSDALTFNLSAAFSNVLRSQPFIFRSLGGSEAAVTGIVTSPPSGMQTGKIDAVVGALSELGKVHRGEGGFVHSQSEVPAHFKRTREIYYVDTALTLEATPTTASQTRTQLSKVEVGFSLDVRPRLLPGGIVNVVYDLSLDQLLKLETITNAQGQIIQQRPEIARRRNRQALPLAAGDTFISAAYTLDERRIDDAAPVTASLPVFGGRRSSATSSTISVIMITAQVGSPSVAPLAAAGGGAP